MDWSLSQTLSWRDSEIVFSQVQLSAHKTFGLNITLMIRRSNCLIAALKLIRIQHKPRHTLLAQAHERTSAPVSLVLLLPSALISGEINPHVRLQFPGSSLQVPSREHGMPVECNP